MFCEQCGVEMPQGSVVCSNCGARVIGPGHPVATASNPARVMPVQPQPGYIVQSVQTPMYVRRVVHSDIHGLMVGAGVVELVLGGFYALASLLLLIGLTALESVTRATLPGWLYLVVLLYVTYTGFLIFAGVNAIRRDEDFHILHIVLGGITVLLFFLGFAAESYYTAQVLLAVIFQLGGGVAILTLVGISMSKRAY